MPARITSRTEDLRLRSFFVSNMDNCNEPIRGLYFPEPHAALMMSGEKTLVAKATHEAGHRTRDLRGEWLLVTKRDGCGLILGAVGIGEPRNVGCKAFDRYHSQHRVSKKERLAWWADKDDLWIYPIEWRVELPEPRRCVVPAGTQTVMRDVETEASDRFLEKAAAALPAEIPWTAGFVWLDNGQVVTGSGIEAEAALGPEVAQRLKQIAEQHPGAQGAVPVYDLVLRRRERLEYVTLDDDNVEGVGEGAEAETSAATAAGKGDQQPKIESAGSAPGAQRAKSQTKEAGPVPERPSPLIVLCAGDGEGEYLIGTKAGAGGEGD